MKNICKTSIQVLIILLSSIFTLGICLFSISIGIFLLHIKTCIVLIKNRLKNSSFSFQEAFKQSMITIKLPGFLIKLNDGN